MTSDDGNQPPGFFTTLGALASRQQENQLSRSLKACFDHSTEFRRVLLRLARSKLNLMAAPLESYTCRVEVGVGRRVGRLDLRFQVRGKAKASFCIESKVGATIGEDQLRKYHRHGVTNLLLVTKHPPQVSDRTLRRFGVQAIRWQDVHHALQSRMPTHGRDRFLFNSFTDYLEEAGMAYPAHITGRDLSYMAATFRAIRAHSAISIVPRDGFDAANRCMEVLRVIEKNLRDQYRPVEDARTWGPGYYNVVNQNKHLHALSVILFRAPYSRHQRLLLAIYIPQKSGRMRWSVEFYKSKKIDSQYEDLPLGRFMKKGVLQTDAMLSYALKWAKRWKVRL